jgi:hypothetical protein
MRLGAVRPDACTVAHSVGDRIEVCVAVGRDETDADAYGDRTGYPAPAALPCRPRGRT